jgi:hypothetical protein
MLPLQLMKAVIMARKSERPSLVLTQEQRTTLSLFQMHQAGAFFVHRVGKCLAKKGKSL